MASDITVSHSRLSLIEWTSAITFLSLVVAPVVARAGPVDPPMSCADDGAPGSPTDGKNHGSQKNPIKLNENRGESIPLVTLNFPTKTGSCLVIEPGTKDVSSDMLDFMKNPDNKNKTDVAGTSDKEGDVEPNPDTEIVKITNGKFSAFYQLVDAPEPTSLTLLGAGLAGLAIARRRKGVADDRHS